PSSDKMRAQSFRTGRSISALMLREMSTTYGKSAGGYAWAILEPVVAIAILSMAFQLVFRQPRLGNNFPFYFATGYLPYMIALDIMNNTARSIRFSRSLLAYPGVTWTDAIFARTLLSFVTDVGIMLIVMTAIFTIFSINTILDFASIATALAMAVGLAMGIGSLNCYLFTAIPPWERVWSAVTRPLVLLSGVIFLYDTMPPIAQNVVWWNPLLHVVGMARRGFFPSYDATYVSVPYVAGIALVCGAFGFMLLHRHHKALLNA
ncbi:MAG: ABC transporter permease, partial [Roseovarius sp.]